MKIVITAAFFLCLTAHAQIQQDLYPPPIAIGTMVKFHQDIELKRQRILGKPQMEAYIVEGRVLDASENPSTYEFFTKGFCIVEEASEEILKDERIQTRNIKAGTSFRLISHNTGLNWEGLGREVLSLVFSSPTMTIKLGCGLGSRKFSKIRVPKMDNSPATVRMVTHNVLEIFAESNPFPRR